MTAVIREGTVESFLERSYRRLGPRYPGRAILLALLLNEVVILLAAAALRLYLDMTAGEFVSVLALAMAFELVHDLIATRLIRRSVAAAVRWIEGDRDAESTGEAWRTAATLPWDFVRRDATPVAPMGMVVWTFIPLWCAFLTWRLSLPLYKGAVIFVGAAVYFAYAYVLRLLSVERVMQPVVADIARALPGPAPNASGLPLQTRLLATLPAINVITAVLAFGIARGGHADLTDLAIVSLVATGVAATASLALTALLARSVTAPISELRAAALRVGQGELDLLVPVVTVDETGDLTRAFNEMTTGLAERERLRDAFGTFVDPTLAERVARDGTDLRGEQVEVSILFMDVRGFTSLSERSNAHEVVAHLNALYELVVPVIVQHGGHANKFIGDGLLAVFGAPGRLTDHADRAVAAALEIAEKVRAGAAGDLEVGLGVNSGTVVVGTIGGGGRLDFTVIGDAVNTASRVESATRQTGDDLLITRATKELLSAPQTEWHPREPIALKGKSAMVQLYAPTGDRATTAAQTV